MLSNMLGRLNNVMIPREVTEACWLVQGVAPCSCGERCSGARPGAARLRGMVEGGKIISWHQALVLFCSACFYSK